MPTAKAFSSIPPFPDDVPIVHLPRLSLAKLMANDRHESEELFRGCRTDGFLQLDMRTTPEGEALLAEAEILFEINREVNDASLDEKMKFAFQPSKSLFGYDYSFCVFDWFFALVLWAPNLSILAIKSSTSYLSQYNQSKG